MKAMLTMSKLKTMPKAEIYTKKGDGGETGFLTGKRVRKDDPRAEAVGSLDELNSQIGVVLAQIEESRLGLSDRKNLTDKLSKTQSDLFLVGSIVAGYEPKENNLEKRLVEIEAEIDELEAKLPDLDNFTPPGGRTVGAELHLARSVCRRAERAVVGTDSTPVFSYMNRLSDYLFHLARWVNFKEGQKEQIWTPRK